LEDVGKALDNYACKGLYSKSMKKFLFPFALFLAFSPSVFALTTITFPDGGASFRIQPSDYGDVCFFAYDVANPDFEASSQYVWNYTDGDSGAIPNSGIGWNDPGFNGDWRALIYSDFEHAEGFTSYCSAGYATTFAAFPTATIFTWTSESGIFTPSEAPDPVYGCTDPEANNYDPEATEDDDSCTYDPPEPEPVEYLSIGTKSDDTPMIDIIFINTCIIALYCLVQLLKPFARIK